MRALPDDQLFRSLHAPGLDEDDLFAALQGLPPALARADVAPPASARAESGWDPARERRRRHAELLRKWPARERPGPADSA